MRSCRSARCLGVGGLATALAWLAACGAAPASPPGEGLRAAASGPLGAVVYYHGMANTEAVVAPQIRPLEAEAARAEIPFLAPRMLDGRDGSYRMIQGLTPMRAPDGAPLVDGEGVPLDHPQPWSIPALDDFLHGRRNVTVAGYSLGRVPMLMALQRQDAVVNRALLLDPSYDTYWVYSVSEKGRGWQELEAGKVVLDWLRRDTSRRFVFVVGAASGWVQNKLLAPLAALRGEEQEPARRAYVCSFPGLGHAQILGDADGRVFEAVRPGWEDERCVPLRFAPCSTTDRCFVSETSRAVFSSTVRCATTGTRRLDAAPPEATTPESWHCRLREGVNRWCRANGECPGYDGLSEWAPAPPPLSICERYPKRKSCVEAE
ncbi:MAG: hypothetical protein IT371_10430 [Deltaproteobacteria bacterium]|nr:hypothetical protein [Deltaproteobacteria bacterium]